MPLQLEDKTKQRQMKDLFFYKGTRIKKEAPQIKWKRKYIVLLLPEGYGSGENLFV